MKKQRLAIFMEDEAYRMRFVPCILKHYGETIELHVFDCKQDLKEETILCYDACLVEGREEELSSISKKAMERCVVLTEGSRASAELFCCVNKYEDVPRIMEQVLRCMAEESGEGVSVSCKGTRLCAVYSLSEGGGTLPFVLSVGMILGEKHKGLLIDVQENSALGSLLENPSTFGLEDLLLMAENGNGSKNRMLSGIEHLELLDVVYPVKNSECLCEANGELYLKLIAMIQQHLDYDYILLNLSARFLGFFQLLDACDQLYLLSKPDNWNRWREKEFFEEMARNDCLSDKNKIKSVEILPFHMKEQASMRVLEQWKWGDFCGFVRNILRSENSQYTT